MGGWGGGISNSFGNYGDRSNLSEQRETDNDEKALANVDMEGGDLVIDDLVDVVSGDLLEIRGEQVQIAKLHDKEETVQEEQEVLMALAPWVK